MFRRPARLTLRTFFLGGAAVGGELRLLRMEMPVAFPSARHRVTMEASGQARRFERLLPELQCALWIGDAAAIHAKRVRKQKTDRQDAQLILRLIYRKNKNHFF